MFVLRLARTVFSRDGACSVLDKPEAPYGLTRIPVYRRDGASPVLDKPEAAYGLTRIPVYCRDGACSVLDQTVRACSVLDR